MLAFALMSLLMSGLMSIGLMVSQAQMGYAYAYAPTPPQPRRAETSSSFSWLTAFLTALPTTFLPLRGRRSPSLTLDTRVPAPRARVCISGAPHLLPAHNVLCVERQEQPLSSEYAAQGVHRIAALISDFHSPGEDHEEATRRITTGRAVRDARIDRGFTLQELADQGGMSKDFLFILERGGATIEEINAVLPTLARILDTDLCERSGSCINRPVASTQGE